MSNIDFGLYLTRRNLPVSETFEYYRRSIQALPLGFTTLWVEDHLQWGEIPTLECLTTLSFLTAAFPSFRVGSLVLSQSYRNPALVAKMAANIQLLSHGRLILGIGAGWKKDEYIAYGYPFPSTQTRIKQLEEAVLVIKSMWSKQPANFVSQHYQVRSAYCQPQPLQPIPLLIGGGGEQRTLRLVAQYADWWNLTSCTTEEYARKVAILKKHCNDVGRDFTEIKLTYSSWMNVNQDQSQLMRDPSKHIIAGNRKEVLMELERFCELGITHFMLKFPDIDTQNYFSKEILSYFI